MTESADRSERAKERRVDAGWLQTLIVISALGGFMFLLNSQIADVRRAVDNVRVDLGKLGERVARVETRFDGVEARLDGVEARMARVETRLDGVETRLDGVETRLVGVEARLVNVETELDGIKIQLGNRLAEAKAAKTNPVLAQTHERHSPGRSSARIQ